MDERCLRCDRPLTRDETALTRKLLNRGATRFLCLRCLADHFDASVDQLAERIRFFREMGCTLFEEGEKD